MPITTKFTPEVEQTIDVARLRQLLEYLTAHPEEHEQGLWARRTRSSDGSCKTACCAAGWTIALSEDYSLKWRKDALCDGLDIAEYAENKRGWGRHISEVARDLLGFTRQQAAVFFDTTNSLYRLWGYANRWTNQEIVRPDNVTPSGVRS